MSTFGCHCNLPSDATCLRRQILVNGDIQGAETSRRILGYFAVFICPAESEIVMLEWLIDRKTESHKRDGEFSDTKELLRSPDPKRRPSAVEAEATEVEAAAAAAEAEAVEAEAAEAEAAAAEAEAAASSAVASAAARNLWRHHQTT
ncbi:hypothetical protein AALP_AA7G133500 [Arabis alpina]|uniref:Uncharacterized protein n=1 Tax=Arabis alpina TaxID=50452 RepID=A0A087GHS8_ARAAL|nr:hypothetical protein AALP_AA7G133500 [Arabis alpina]